MAIFNEVSFFGLAPSWSSRRRFAHEQQSSELQAEKRGNFVVVGCIEASKVVSWSLNVSSVLILGQRDPDRIYFPGSKRI
jgi:hypothetical protein